MVLRGGWGRPAIRARIDRLSPILVRPIREQFEHDRVVRQLQSRWRRRFSVTANPADELNGQVRLGVRILHPDLILNTTGDGRRLHALVEVETAESVNHLEAMAQWTDYAKVRGAFYLYVPAGLSDVALRLCKSGEINVSEIWSYYFVGGQIRFVMSYRSEGAKRAAKARAKVKALGKAKKSTGGKASKKTRKSGATKAVKKTRKTTSARKGVKAKAGKSTRSKSRTKTASKINKRKSTKVSRLKK